MNRRTSATPVIVALVVLVALVALAGCRPFDIKTPPGMIELEKTDDYAYRAMTPEGVVVGVRFIKDAGKADVPFWTRAVSLHMKELSGYALTETKDATARDGSKGQELHFGHDESGKPYTYVVRVFVKDNHLFVAEAGGTKEEMDRAKQTVEWTLATLMLK
jgi:hypothetical protein